MNTWSKICVLKSDLRKIWLASNVPERNYCVIRGAVCSSVCFAFVCLDSQHANLYTPVVRIIYRVFTKEWYGLKNSLNDYILQLDGAPPPKIFTEMYESYSIVFSNSAGSDVLHNGHNHIHVLYGTNSIIVWMCVVWPRVHTLKDYD
jgi:hypothetical protein